MRPIAYVSHAIPGRVRFRIPAKRGDVEYFSSLKVSLASFPEITDIRINPSIGSVLIEYNEASMEQLEKLAIKSQLFSLEALAYEPKAIWQRVSSSVDEVDSRFKNLTRGDIDFRSVVFIGLGVMGIRQLLKGQVMAPATTLLWYALQLLMSSKNN